MSRLWVVLTWIVLLVNFVIKAASAFGNVDDIRHSIHVLGAGQIFHKFILDGGVGNMKKRN